MGKAAQRRLNRRRQYLAGLALTDRDRFLGEWNKRVRSWLYEAWRRAGHLSPEDMPAAFSLVAEAKQVLAGCQDSLVVLDARRAIGELEAECSRALASNSDDRLYVVTGRYKR